MQPQKYRTIRHYNAPGETHLLTFSCFRRKRFLVHERSRRWFLESLGAALDQHQYGLWAWVVMPEHVHLLVHPRREYRVEEFLKSLKKSVGQKAVHFVRREAPEFLIQMRDRQPSGKTCYRFWQRGPGHDENLWTGRYIWDKVQYIHMNPVRRGLVLRPEDWTWSSCLDFHRARVAPLAIDFEAMPLR